MDRELLGQILGILATLITFFCYQTNSKRTLLVALCLATLSNGASYLMLGATSGFLLNLVCIIRNIAFYFLKEGTRKNLIAAIGFAVAIVACGALSWQGLLTLLILIPLAVNTMFLSFGKPQVLRFSIFYTSTSILLYDIFVHSYGGVALEAVAITSAVIGSIRYYRIKKKEEETKVKRV